MAPPIPHQRGGEVNPGFYEIVTLSLFAFVFCVQLFGPNLNNGWCTMLICGSYKCRYEGHFWCNDDILD